MVYAAAQQESGNDVSRSSGVGMSNVLFEHPADIVGYSRLAIAAVLGLTDLVETAHQNIALSPGVFGQPAQGATPGITGLVYKTI